MLQGVPSLLVAQTGLRPISFVQAKSYGSTAGAISHTITLTSPPTAGNILVLGVAANVLALPIPPNGRWSATNFKSAVDATGSYMFWMISNGSEQTIVVTLASSDNCCLGVIEFTGCSRFDASATAIGQGPGSIGTGTTGSTAKPYELLVSLAGISNGGGAVGTITSWSNSFTSRVAASTSGGGVPIGINMATRVVTVSATYTTTGTLSAGTAVNDSGIIMTFN